MHVCYVAKIRIAGFTASDAIYHVPYSVAGRHDLTLLSAHTTEGRALYSRLKAERIVPPRRAWPLAACRELGRLHREAPVDLVLTGIDEASVLVGIYARFRFGIRWMAVCEDHPFQSRYHAAGFFKRLEEPVRVQLLRVALRLPRRLIYFIHPGVLEFLRLPESRRALLTNSADLESIGPVRQRIAESPGPDDGTERICAIGQLSEVKGTTFLLEMFRHVAAARPSARLCLIGQTDPAYEEKLVRLLREYELEDRVERAGLLPADLALEAAGRCIICLHAYRPVPWLYWNQVLKICEYLALGRPVVSVDYPGVRDLFGQRKCGVLTPPDDPKAMAEAVLALLNDAAALTRMAEQATMRADEISWARTEEKLFEILEADDAPDHLAGT